MKYLVRSLLLLFVLLLVATLLSGCSSGPAGVPPITLEHARQLEALTPDKAVDEYTAIKNLYDGHDQEKAAQALLELAKFTSDRSRYGTPQQVHALDPNNLSKAAQDQIEQLREKGDNLARESLKTLYLRYGESAAAKDQATRALQLTVDRTIDQRNSKAFTYKLMDALVNATGRNPAFSYWFALLVIAVTLKVVTFPLMLVMYKSSREMQRMQPIIKAIQEKHKEDPTESNRKMQEAYKEHGVNPFASCIPSLVQLPVFIWMFNLVRIYEVHFGHGHFFWVGSALSHRFPTFFAPDLGQLDIPILLLYAGSMFVTMRLTPQADPAMAQQQQQMSVMMTFFMVWWFIQSRWSSAFLLYYLFQNVLSAAQQYHFVYKPNRARLVTAGAAGAGANLVIDLPSSAIRDYNGSGDTRNGNREDPKPRPRRKAPRK